MDGNLRNITLNEISKSQKTLKGDTRCDGGEAHRFLGWVLGSPICIVNKHLAYICYI